MTDGAASDLHMADFDYALPQELIAQTPLIDRSASRLLVIDRHGSGLAHRRFTDLPELLASGDLLVLNDSRVIPARLQIRRRTGGLGEILLLAPTGEAHHWTALARPSRRMVDGEVVSVLPVGAQGRDGEATIVAHGDNGTVVVALGDDVAADLHGFGRVPLPPYITEELNDPERYQTVYGVTAGSVAAPTAGLHFTDDLFAQLRLRGVELAHVTLHVGLDTFRPVAEELARDHRIHTEWCAVSPEAVAAIQACRSRGGRVIAGGTTSARTLETLGRAVQEGDPLRPFTGPTDIYITPGHRWQVVDGLVTNFHLPRSTLLLMVSAFASRETILGAYAAAIRERYRFFSFGDATLIL